MKRAALLLFCCAFCFGARAQVHVDKPVDLTSTDSTLRSVEGLAPATVESALITLGDAQSGRYQWGTASGTGMAIALALDPPCTAYASGLSVRFMPVHPGYGAVTLNVNGLGAKRIYRSDGLLVSMGQLDPGTITEMVYADTAFFLQVRAESGCPSGFLPVNGHYCIQANDTLHISIYNATRWCMERGARLCTWDEYIHACTVQQVNMQGLFDDWEWIDDTSDHTHTAVQAGRTQCRSQRAWGALEDPNNYAQVRCCYRLK